AGAAATARIDLLVAAKEQAVDELLIDHLHLLALGQLVERVEHGRCIRHAAGTRYNAGDVGLLAAACRREGAAAGNVLSVRRNGVGMGERRASHIDATGCKQNVEVLYAGALRPHESMVCSADRAGADYDGTGPVDAKRVGIASAAADSAEIDHTAGLRP